MRAAVCRALGPPEVVQVEELPDARRCGPARRGCASAPPRSTSPTCCSSPASTRSRLPSRSWSAASSPASWPRWPTTCTTSRSATGSRAPGSPTPSPRRSWWRRGALTAAPAGLSDVDAAAAGVAHRTAMHVLRSTARLEPGEELVVLGAGGGVGLAAVQLGVALGASVTAVASSDEKLAVAAEHGAAHLVRHGDGRPPRGAARGAPGRRRRRRRPRRRRPRRTGAPLAALRRPVRERRLRLGRRSRGSRSTSCC